MNKLMNFLKGFAIDYVIKYLIDNKKEVVAKLNKEINVPILNSPAVLISLISTGDAIAPLIDDSVLIDPLTSISPSTCKDPSFFIWILTSVPS